MSATPNAGAFYFIIGPRDKNFLTLILQLTGGTEDNHENHNQYVWSLSRVPNWRPPKNKAGVQTIFTHYFHDN
jgi:hypothetical protein